MNEHELIEAIRMVVDAGTPGVRVGIGDDAAVVDAGSGDLVLAADMLVEGVDFHPSRSAPRDLGAKAMAVNLSDLAAMGAGPRYALVSLGLPSGVDVAWVVELFGGLRDAGDACACTIVGGDLSAAGQVVVSITVAGSVAPGKAVTRAGARAGDVLVVTGPLGAAAAGLVLVEADARSVRDAAASDAGRSALEALARPTPRIAEGHFLASRGATAMIDLSDGLARDLHRLCRASRVAAHLDADAVPIAPALLELSEVLPSAPEELARYGGEDFELLAAIPAERAQQITEGFFEAFHSPLFLIGSMVEGDGVSIEEADAGVVPLPDRGWDHFG